MRTKLSRMASKAERHRPVQPVSTSRPVRVIDDAKPLTAAASAISWRVVTTAPRMEAKAAQSLQEAGWQVWYPQLTCWVSSARLRIKRRVHRPLFPRYLFVTGSGHHAITGCDHVGYLLPNQAFGALVRNLSDRQMAGEFDASQEAPDMTGQTMRMTDGPFSGFIGIVAKHEGERVRLLVEFMGKIQNVRVPLDRLEKVA